MAVVLVFLLFGTGLLLKFFYLPFPDKAYESILYIENSVFFGQLIRNVHYWSANFLIIVAFLHLLRVFFTSAFHSLRQFNWVIGSGIFFIILFSNFTGYLLPWDQLSFWAITICIGMLEYFPGMGLWLQELIRGGSEVGPATLSTFYAIHTAVLPAVMIILMMFHFWRVRKAGGLVTPQGLDLETEPTENRIPSIPNLIIKELVVALAMIAFILTLSALLDAPLGDKANPGLSPNPTKAPWYFMGFQEILLHFHPLFALFIFTITTLTVLLIPYMNDESKNTGVWFFSLKGRQLSIITMIVGCLLTVSGIILDQFLFDFVSWMPGLSPVISTGLAPFLICLCAIFVYVVFVSRIYRPDRAELILMLFVLFLTIFFILTITGIWCRGSGMGLVWPWARMV